MRKYLSATLLGLLLGVNVSAQKEVISTVSKLIHAGDYQYAAQYLDSILAINPKCVDALMMKGNVILNESLKGAPQIELASVYDESIYDETIGEIKPAEQFFDKETISKVSQLWQQCVQIAPDRLDIHQGLCTLYDRALMKDEIIKQLPALIKAAGKTNDDFIYGLKDYALAFMYHDRFDDCLDILKAISAAFPQAGGLVGDMAVLCQKQGKIKEAVTYARQALTKKHNDYLTNYNAVTIIAIGENATEGDKAFAALPKDDKNPLYQYYQSIFGFCNNGKSWADDMKGFAHSYKSKEDDDPRPVIAKMMTAKNFKLDTATFAKILALQPYELELLLFDIKAKSEQPDKYRPLISLANLYAGKKCFAQALVQLGELKNLKLTGIQDSTYHFVLAYAQYEDGQKQQSIENWKVLLNAGSFLRQSAACYFIGSAYLEKGEKEKAREYFTQVADRASESKFANYCRWRLDAMK